MSKERHQAFQEGYYHRQVNSGSESDNPYHETHPNKAAWQNGYKMAERHFWEFQQESIDYIKSDIEE